MTKCFHQLRAREKAEIETQISRAKRIEEKDQGTRALAESLKSMSSQGSLNLTKESDES